MSLRHCGVLLVALCVANTNFAQDKPAAEAKRGVYVVQHALAKDLVPVLAKHFKGAADVQAGPEGTSNLILLSAPPAVLDEALKLLDQLDRRPQTIAIDIWLIELPVKKAEGRDKPAEETDWHGPIEEMQKKLEAAQKKGTITTAKQFQLAALEGSSTNLAQRELKAVVIGSTRTATGLISRALTTHAVGTQLRVTPQVMADKSIHATLKLEDSRAYIPENAPQVGVDEKGVPIPSTAFALTTLDTTLSLSPGKTVVVKDATTTPKEGTGQLVIVVGGHLVSAGAKAP